MGEAVEAACSENVCALVGSDNQGVAPYVLSSGAFVPRRKVVSHNQTFPSISLLNIKNLQEYWLEKRACLYN